MLLDLLEQVQVGIGEVDDENFLVLLAQSLERLRFKVYRRGAELLLDKRPLKSDLLTIPQLAQRLQVNPGTLYQRVARGQLEATRIGKCVRVKEADATRVKRTRVQRLA